MAQSDSPIRQPALVIDPFDGLRVFTRPGAELNVANEKARALLAYLSLRSDHLATRERIVGLLWSESAEAKARNALRQCLRKLRLALGNEHGACLSVGRQHIGLRLGGAVSRLDIVLEGLGQGAVDPILTREEGRPERLLYGYDDLDPSLRGWLHILRDSSKTRLTRALEDLMAAASGPAVALRAAEALAFLDPSHEPAQQRLIAAHARAGNTAAALRQYDALWRELDEVHDCEPAPETVDLIASVKLGTFPASQAAAPSAAVPAPAGASTAGTRPTAPVIEIAPFHELSGPPPYDYVLQGFRSELVAALARFREWCVVEPAARYRADAARPDYVVDSEVSQLDDGARFLLFLRDARLGRVIWSETYIAVPQNFGAALRRIVRRISLALNIYLSAERIATATQRADADWHIFDRWLYGQSLSFTWQPEQRDQAEQVFRSILDEAPDFGPTYCSLVMLENTRHLAFPGVLRSDERQRRALNLAKRAVAMDPLDTKAHLAAAWSMVMNNRFVPAQQYFSQAYELNQNDPWTIVSSALGLGFSGALADGLLMAREALQLDQYPSPSHCEYQANLYFLAGDYETCRHWGKLAEGATRDSSGWQVACLAHLGQVAEARTLGQCFVAETAENWHGSGTPDAASVAAWFLQCFPLADPRALERLREGLEIAGIPPG